MNKFYLMFFALYFLYIEISHSSILPPCETVSNPYYEDCVGTWMHESGYKYIGEWKDNRQHGLGFETFSDGEKYIGEYNKGKRHGYFIVYHANGDKYVGEFVNDQKHGHGTSFYANGDKYVGQYQFSKRHGEGTYTFSGGDKYVGEYQDSKPHGQGIYYFLSDNNFKGDKYVGEYQYGKKNGQGIYTFSDGRKGEGEWKDDKPDGYFIEYDADGSIDREGIFKNGEFLYAEAREKKDPSKLDKYKSTCEELEFLLGKEKFGDCVMKLMDKD